MDQISGTTPADAQAPEDDGRSVDTGTSAEPSEVGQPGFGARGRMRRRLRFLRKARELAYRDLGGLVFNLHRFGQRNDPLVMAKLTTLGHIDSELRAIEDALRERRAVTVLREAGITACARCAAIHSSEDRFCPNCGLSLGPHPELPIAGAATSPAPAPAEATPSAPESVPAAPSPAATAGSHPVPDPNPRPASEPETRTWEELPAGRSAGASPAPAGRGSQSTSGEDEPTEILHPPPSRP